MGQWLVELTPNNICHYILFCLYGNAKISLDNSKKTKSSHYHHPQLEKSCLLFYAQQQQFMG
ncbi:hypothetical protein ACHAXS_007161 [Conticribra weissflogii]